MAMRSGLPNGSIGSALHELSRPSISTSPRVHPAAGSSAPRHREPAGRHAASAAACVTETDPSRTRSQSTPYVRWRSALSSVG